MTTPNRKTLKNLLQSVVPGTVLLARQLENMGISRDLQQYYKRSGWLQSIGDGAFVMPQHKVKWQGALHTIQKQAEVAVHAGGPTALSMFGASHYLRFIETVYLFSDRNARLPKWFTSYDWGQQIANCNSTFLPEKLGLTKHDVQEFSITISSAERAILECLYLIPDVDMVECYHLMEFLTTLRPNVIQELLESCSSIKVKRLFLYMASKLSYAWFKYIDQSKVDLGTGDRNLATNDGVYVKKYGIVVPRTLSDL